MNKAQSDAIRGRGATVGYVMIVLDVSMLGLALAPVLRLILRRQPAVSIP